jgi:two-component system sensor histidine kinase AlgZ
VPSPQVRLLFCSQVVPEPWLRGTRRPALAEARLQALQARIRPHFLFNTLNSAIALVREEPAKAETMLEDLSELFRSALADPNESVTLADEIALAGRYLAIEQVRFGDRLRVRWDIDSAADAARLPPLLLQPLVENSIRHGLEPQIEGGSVLVRAWRDGTQLVIEIVDTGVGIDPAQAIGGPANDGNGFGVAQVRERLTGLHGGHASLTLARPAEHPESGTRATLRFPMQMTTS